MIKNIKLETRKNTFNFTIIQNLSSFLKSTILFNMLLEDLINVI